MEKHTPGPWRTAERSGFPFHIDDARGESVAVMLADEDHDEQRGLENARRIVACVNACSGIPTDLLEAIPEFEKSGMQTINSVMKQRDQLLAYLRGIAEESTDEGAREHALAAIAAVEQPAAEAVADADGWIEWKGGECPFDDNQKCDVRVKSGQEIFGYNAASWNWMHYSNTGDIVAYRVVEGGES